MEPIKQNAMFLENSFILGGQQHLQMKDQGFSFVFSYLLLPDGSRGLGVESTQKG